MLKVHLTLGFCPFQTDLQQTVFYMGGMLKMKALLFSLNCTVSPKMRRFIFPPPGYRAKLIALGDTISNCAGSSQLRWIDREKGMFLAIRHLRYPG
jgi:hypothetical protein